MPTAKDGDKVQIHYTGKLTDGTVFDSSDGRDPLEFTLGQHQVIPGFEEAVVGMETGQSKTVTIECDQAYGQRTEDRIMTVALKDLNLDFSPKKGDQLTLQRQDGHQMMVTVTEINESDMTLDANHPLAGKDLVFEINLVAVA